MVRANILGTVVGPSTQDPWKRITVAFSPTAVFIVLLKPKNMEEADQIIKHVDIIWLVVWNFLCLFSIIYGIILPIDFHIFQDGYNPQPDWIMCVCVLCYILGKACFIAPISG